MANLHREAPGLVGFLLLLLPACELSEADVVPRAAQPPPAVIGRDARGNDSSQENREDSLATPDGSDAASDERATTDAGLVAGGTDALDAPGDTVGARDGEHEAGWSCQGLVFCDDFENGRAAWSSAEGTWGITYDTASATPNAVFGPVDAATSTAYVARAAWQDMTVEARVRVLSFGQAAISNRAELYARYQDDGHFYAVSLRGDGKLGLRKNATAIGSAASVAAIQNEWHTLTLRVAGPPGATTITGYLDGRMLAAALDGDEEDADSAAGTAGIGVYGETLASFDDVRVSSP